MHTVAIFLSNGPRGRNEQCAGQSKAGRGKGNDNGKNKARCGTEKRTRVFIPAPDQHFVYGVCAVVWARGTVASMDLRDDGLVFHVLIRQLSCKMQQYPQPTQRFAMSPLKPINNTAAFPLAERRQQQAS